MNFLKSVGSEESVAFLLFLIVALTGLCENANLSI